jgi:membrane protease YdiL (CAAX protease family)
MFAAFLAALAFLGFLGMALVIVMSGKGATSTPAGLGMMTLSVVATALTLAATAVVFASPRTRARLALVRFPSRPLIWLAATLGVLALGQALDAAITLAGLFDVGALGTFRRALASAGSHHLPRSLLCFGLLAGTAEELFFRGLLQPRFVERWGPRTGILVTSALFGLMHFDGIHSTLALGMGLWLGFVRHRTGSVLPAVAAHVVNNVVATLAAAAGLVPGSTGETLALGLAALAVLALALVPLWRLAPPAPPAQVAALLR